MFTLKPFQEEAIAKLKKTFLELWKTGNFRLPLVLKAPTGSGKTIMVAQFLKDLTGDPQFNVDKAFLWFSFSEESYQQSKKKLFEYYGGASELDLLDLNDLNRGKLEKNNVFFINWQKIKDSTKDSRKLRRDNEQGLTFDNFIKNTQEAGRELILIVDEAHRDKETDLASELIDLINPRIILDITATPKNIPNNDDIDDKKAGYVRVKKEDVVEAGLIKEKIITQTKEDVETIKKKEYDQDLLLLELAFNKRLELIDDYKKLKLNINPLVLIQLPNDDKATNGTMNQSKLDIVKNYLREKKVDNDNIAIWLSEKKENLESIEKNNSAVDFLIFKQAAATGWDCPRAGILVMFREIKTPVFHIQTVGRILRMPEAQHYPIKDLNIAYLFTNYERNQILAESNKQGENKLAIFTSHKREDIEPLQFESVFMSRTDYNDLGDSFQAIFSCIADEFFGIGKDESISNVKSKIGKKVEVNNLHIQNNLIVGVEIEDYDNFIYDIKNRGEDLSLDSSKNDLERLYNLICFNLIALQEDENKKFAPERSWGKVKTAFNVYFANSLKMKREDYYKLIVKDLLMPDSQLKSILSRSLEAYRPIREIEVKHKAQRSKRIETVEIPPKKIFYTDDFEEVKKAKKSAMQPVYFQKEYLGKINENKFLQYLEAKSSIEWWYKNGDFGSEFFAVPYVDRNQDRMFYPDWIVKTKKGIIILETKAGDTAMSENTKNKAEALQEWIETQKIKVAGGIVVNDGGIWKINKNSSYQYSANFKEWELLDDWLV